MTPLARSIAGATFLAAASGGSAVAQMAALVLDATGATSPEVAVFQELAAGTRLHLSPGTRLTMSHYKQCEEVSFTGGTVLIGPDDLDVSGASDVDRVSAPCAEAVQLVAADIANAAVVTRSSTVATAVGLAPEVVLSGPSGRRFDTLKIVEGKRLIATVPLDGPHVRLAQHNVTLTDGRKYAFFFTGRDIRQYAVSVVVRQDVSGLLVLAP